MQFNSEYYNKLDLSTPFCGSRPWAENRCKGLEKFYKVFIPIVYLIMFGIYIFSIKPSLNWHTKYLAGFDNFDCYLTLKYL